MISAKEGTLAVSALIRRGCGSRGNRLGRPPAWTARWRLPLCAPWDLLQLASPWCPVRGPWKLLFPVTWKAEKKERKKENVSYGVFSSETKDTKFQKDRRNSELATENDGGGFFKKSGPSAWVWELCRIRF